MNREYIISQLQGNRDPSEKSILFLAVDGHGEWSGAMYHTTQVKANSMRLHKKVRFDTFYCSRDGSTRSSYIFLNGEDLDRIINSMKHHPQCTSHKWQLYRQYGGQL